MKNTILSMSLGMAGGMALATYMLSNPSMKKRATKMLNDAMDDASCAINDMKKNFKKNN